ncbi:LuxR C-terminal-related transcriptional regulator [Tropicimonas isoalkanivorans]|uniref:DNA-binding response regulator, NarL/FixJ family, contains REC and HTH domains n=1 Tax=Tropicimonas isoalkanivorans TaxID=441112 RepID=A0A1I1LLE7_9RHOB|nr:response regulator transcription factor [Tropicimonas isoalkanivorans]SFC73851.1 DNA-binding response regulator, NarL/FixJ family, contains REC and HTH domains [Tropicimonas isoalkanivorans]
MSIDRGVPKPTDSGTICIISTASFERDCLAQSLRHAFPAYEIFSLESEADWSADTCAEAEKSVVLYSIGAGHLSDEETKAKLKAFIARVSGRRVIVLAQSEDMSAWFDAIECGAVGYISPSVGLEDLVEMIRISSARNILMPRKSVMLLRQVMPTSQPEPGSELARWFTDRQLDVAEALQRGAANKIIAYELDLCESTVKVHIRNIMRKLKASNRTEAAFKLSQIASGTLKPEGAQAGGSDQRSQATVKRRSSLSGTGEGSRPTA